MEGEVIKMVIKEFRMPSWMLKLLPASDDVPRPSNNKTETFDSQKY